MWAGGSPEGYKYRGQQDDFTKTVNYYYCYYRYYYYCCYYYYDYYYCYYYCCCCCCCYYYYYCCCCCCYYCYYYYCCYYYCCYYYYSLLPWLYTAFFIGLHFLVISKIVLYLVHFLGEDYTLNLGKR